MVAAPVASAQTGGVPGGTEPTPPTAQPSSAPGSWTTFKTATWYGPGFWGRSTACGITLTPTTLGVAHKKLPCGTQVTFSYADRSVAATVIDRGPFHKGYAWDLTKKVAKRLGFLAVGAGPSRPRSRRRRLVAYARRPWLRYAAAYPRRTAGSELSSGSAAAEANRLWNSARAISATASMISSSLQPASRASSTRWCGGRSSWASVARISVRSAASFSSEEVKLRARATSSRPSPATRAVRAYWVSV